MTGSFNNKPPYPRFEGVINPPLKIEHSFVEAVPKGILPAMPPESLDDFWRNLFPNGMTIKQVNNELSDFKMLIGNLSKIYSHITGHVVSKPNTTAEAVLSLFDDHVTELVNDEIKDILDVIAEVYDIPRYELEDCK